MKRYEVGIVETNEEWEAVKLIRETAFMIEDNETTEECWDGNDFAGAVHIIARVDGRPAGCMRIRIVSMADGGTVTWEKLAIDSNHRGSLKLFHRLADFAERVTTEKGCRRVMGTVYDSRLRKFWEKRGFRPTGEQPKVYAGKEYVPYHRVKPLPVPERITTHDSIQNEPKLFRRLTAAPGKQKPLRPYTPRPTATMAVPLSGFGDIPLTKKLEKLPMPN